MVRARLIPCLLIKNNGLVKTTKFADPRYLGDPINAVKIFNDMEADELVVYDIDATEKGSEPNFDYLAQLSGECRMPLCYGGGVKSVEHALKLVDLGIEKISLNSVLYENTRLIEKIANKIGNQSVVVTIDLKIKKSFLKSNYVLTSHNNSRLYPEKTLKNELRFFEDNGAGEIIVNSVDRDGTMAGYDFNLIKELYHYTKIPMTFIGGASS